MGEYLKNCKTFVGEGLGTLRAEMIEGKAWFYAVDICKILDLPKMHKLVGNGTIKEGEYVLTERLLEKGRRKIYLVNVKGVNALLNTKKAWEDVDKLVAFASWFGEEIIDALHKINVDTESIKLKAGDKVVKEFPKKEEKVTAAIPDWVKKEDKKTKVNGYVCRMNASEVHLLLDITDGNLAKPLHDYLIVSARNMLTKGRYTEAEEILHDANRLADLLDQYNTATKENK